MRYLEFSRSMNDCFVCVAFLPHGAWAFEKAVDHNETFSKPHAGHQTARSGSNHFLRRKDTTSLFAPGTRQNF